MVCPSCHNELADGSLGCPSCRPSHPEDATTGSLPASGGGLFAGKFRRIRELGRGGMGVVWLAEDIRLKRLVALKFLSADLAADAPARARFLREAQAAAALESPYVCAVHEADEADGRAYIAMAFIEGRTLRDRLAEGPLRIEEALDLSRQMVAGVAQAHRKRIAHRDLKPSNIMLAHDQVATVTDFGLARVQGSGESTKTAGVAGTLAYMSPEQAQGLPTDLRADVWSLGCVIYEMLAGRAPFSSATGQVDIYALLHGPLRPVTDYRPEAPPQITAIIERCLQKNPQNRYADAGALLGDLQAMSLADAVPHAPGRSFQEVPSIAVLPFADMSPDRSQGYFAEGIAEELIHTLARVRGLRVVARTSAFALRDKGLDVREIGRTLDVDAVVEGSVRASGSRLRVTAQLISVADGFHLWSERFDRDAGDIFAIQDELSLSIVERLKVTLHVGEREALQRRPTVDHEAYNLYLKGLYLVARPRPDTLNTALRFFQEALERDPGFARAYAGIANVYGMFGNFNFAPPNEAWPKAKAAVAQALALDADLAEAHAVAAVAAFWYDWDWVAAEASFNRLLTLNPGDAFTRGAYAWFLLNRRRFDECLREIQVCISLDPLLPLFYGWSVGLHTAVGKLDEAIAMFTKAVEIDPTFGLPYFHASMAYLRMGRIDDAARTAEAGCRIAAHPGWAETGLAMIESRRGNADGAQRIIDEAIRQRPQTHASPVSLAWALGKMGRVDEAIDWMETGIAERDTLTAFLHIYTPWIAPLLARDPRFLGMLERLGLADVAGVMP